MTALSWAERLCGAEGLPVRSWHVVDDGALDAQLAEIWQTARAAWPGVDLDADMFIGYLVHRLPERASPAALSQMNTTDLYLACACGIGDAHAIAAFERHCLDGLHRALARMQLGPDVIAEVKQRIRCRVLVADGGPPRIAEFSGRGRLSGWIRVMAVREALRVTRRSQRETASDDIDELHAAVVQDSPGLERLKADHRRAFARAFDHALRQLDARDRTMLRQYFLDRLTIDQLGALYRVHRATAARTLERGRRSILAATRAHMRAELDVSSTELNSILRTIRNDLEVTLRGLRRRSRR